MKKMEKTKVQIRDIPYIYLDSDLLQGEIKEVSKNILAIKKKLKEAYDLREKSLGKDRLVDIFTPFKDYKYINLNVNNYDGYSEVNIEVWRDETDEEYNKRLADIKRRSASAKKSAKNRKESQVKREKTLLETLKKKYEK